jgi:hypothetical protein
MMKRSLICAASAVVALALPPGGLEAKTPAWRKPRVALERSIVRAIRAEFYESDAASYGFFVADLNDDAVPEVLALGEAAKVGSCWHTGCNFAVYHRSSREGWTAVLVDVALVSYEADATQFQLLERKEHGFRAIRIDALNKTWEFGGEYYAESAPPPAVPESPETQLVETASAAQLSTLIVAAENADAYKAVIGSLRSAQLLPDYAYGTRIEDLNDDGSFEAIVNTGCGTIGYCSYLILTQTGSAQWKEIGAPRTERLTVNEDRSHGFRSLSGEHENWWYNGRYYTTTSQPTDAVPSIPSNSYGSKRGGESIHGKMIDSESSAGSGD